MVLEVRRYADLRLQGCRGPLPFQRIAGLALEVGYKLSRDKGQGKVQAADLGVVQLRWKKLQVREGQAWRKTRAAVNLTVREPERALALQVLRSQRAFLADLHCNLCSVDLPTPAGVTSPWDALGLVAGAGQ